MESFWFALLLSTFAGLSTGIGSLMAYLIKKPKLSYLAFGLGLSAGVMLYVSFVELLDHSFEVLGEGWGLVLFFIGIGVIALIDALVPEVENPHHLKSTADLEKEAEEESVGSIGGNGVSQEDAAQNPSHDSLMRTGILTALVIAIHNFPEGLATFGIALGDLNLGFVIAFAIAVHNIPEGLSVSFPIYYATGDKRKAFLYSFFSGVAEPIGAIIGFLILLPILSETVIGGLFGFIAGIMVYISLDEILPTAHKYGKGHAVLAGLVLGMLVMAISLLLL